MDTGENQKDRHPGEMSEVLEKEDQLQRDTELKLSSDRINRMITQIKMVMAKEPDLTWGEWGEVVEYFSHRIGRFVSLTKINFLK